MIALGTVIPHFEMFRLTVPQSCLEILCIRTDSCRKWQIPQKNQAYLVTTSVNSRQSLARHGSKTD
jgi:hypothetical protein